MTIYVMLTVDLNRGVNEDARDKFNQHMKDKLWAKLKLTTTWQARFAEGVTPDSAISTAKSDVRNAAANAGIAYYEAAIQAGTSAPTIWNQLD